ncbi:sugar transferase [Ruegeria sp. R14_0]|uniref:sugar transferase n=1 Tax=Ruegeria sp. R14_0 TaxID=2821100 RepID=UPI001FFE0763|nr:sugar transferase [Ruegeria sp. R14_0]
MDIVLVLIGAPFVLPLMLLIALVIKLDGGPAIYRQKRVGLGGQEFGFLKFRSMVPNADRLLKKHLEENPAAAAEWETKQKLENDPRVTRFGRIIRATSLDELPQLWNVLTGDMSLVGPRPMMPEQQPLYPGLDYNLMRPGITGLWQVSKRNQVEFSHRAIFDSEYARNIGFWVDLKILFRTIGAVCNGTGR